MNGLKHILGNGFPYGLLFFGLSFLLSYYSFHLSLQSSLLLSAGIGVAALFANGLTYRRFARPLKDLENIQPPLNGEEVVTLQTPANHLLDERLVPGKLVLTRERLLFQPAAIAEGVLQSYSWQLSQLQPIGFYGSVWNAGGEFLFETEEKASIMFEVNELKRWKMALL